MVMKFEYEKCVIFRLKDNFTGIRQPTLYITSLKKVVSIGFRAIHAICFFVGHKFPRCVVCLKCHSDVCSANGDCKTTVHFNLKIGFFNFGGKKHNL